MKWMTLVLIFVLAACASPQNLKDREGFTQLPQELRGVDWTRTPEDVLDSPKEGEPLVWVGQIEEVEVKQQDTKVEIGWICRHLEFADPGPAAISKRPIRVKKGAGYFALSLTIADMSIARAREFQREHTQSPHYLLAGGTFCSMIDRHGRKIPFLITQRISFGPELVEFVTGPP